MKGFYGRELMAVTDGEALARFEDGYPAVVARGNLPPASAQGDGSHISVRNVDDRNPASMEMNDRNSTMKESSEGGCVIMINTFLWYGYALTKDPVQAAFAESLLGRLGVRGRGTNPAVKLKLCKGAQGMVLFAFNYTGEEQKTEYEADGGRRIALVVAPQEAAVKQLT